MNRDELKGKAEALKGSLTCTTKAIEHVADVIKR